MKISKKVYNLLKESDKLIEEKVNKSFYVSSDLNIGKKGDIKFNKYLNRKILEKFKDDEYLQIGFLERTITFLKEDIAFLQEREDNVPWKKIN